MNKFFDKVIPADKKTSKITKIIQYKYYQAIEAGYTKFKIILGKDKIKNTSYNNLNLKGYWDGMGNMIEIQIVDGDRIVVEGYNKFL